MTTTTWTFTYTGSPQTFVVPLYTPGTLTFRLSGGAGGSNGSSGTSGESGGDAGWIRGTLTAAPGTVLTVDLGGPGQNGYSAAAGVDWPHAAGGGGPRPGGQGGTYGSHSFNSTLIPRRCSGGGGGGSELYQGATLIAVAGGGSGGAIHAGTGFSNAYAGAQQTGPGSQSASASTAHPAGDTLGNDGFAGTTSAAGLGGGSTASKYPTYVTDGYPGSGGTGGAGADMIYVPGSPAGGSAAGGGSGAGGGYYGGGGGGATSLLGSAGTGGGGSSWSHSTYVTEGSGPTGAASTLVLVADYLGPWVPPTDGWSVGFLKF